MDVKIEVITLRRFDSGKLKAFADILIDESFVIKGFRIVEGENGLFVGMPQERGKNGRWFNTFLPVNDKARDRLCEIILASYLE